MFYAAYAAYNNAQVVLNSSWGLKKIINKKKKVIDKEIRKKSTVLSYFHENPDSPRDAEFTLKNYSRTFNGQPGVFKFVIHEIVGKF